MKTYYDCSQPSGIQTTVNWMNHGRREYGEKGVQTRRVLRDSLSLEPRRTLQTMLSKTNNKSEQERGEWVAVVYRACEHVCAEKSCWSLVMLKAWFNFHVRKESFITFCRPGHIAKKPIYCVYFIKPSVNEDCVYLLLAFMLLAATTSDSLIQTKNTSNWLFDN